MTKIVLALLSGLLLGCGWLVTPICAWIGFVPLLYVWKDTKFWQFARYCYVAFLVWNLIAAWWLIYIDTMAGMLMFAIVPAIMSLPILVWYRATRSFSENYALLHFPFFWLAYEFLQYQWDFLWSWLTLGNSLAPFPFMIQWYEFTGVLGGSFFILTLNILFFKLFNARIKNFWQYFVAIIALVGTTVGGSLLLHSPIKKENTNLSVVLVQPNIDPIKEKLRDSPQYIPPKKQALQLIKLTKQAITSKAALVVFPEAILGKWFEQSGLDHQGNYSEWDTLHHFFDEYPHTAFLFGLNTYRWVAGKEQSDFTAHFEPPTGYRKRYNTAVLYQKGYAKQFHHKSRRVPSGEYLPLPHFLKPFIPNINQTITTEYPPRLLKMQNGLKIGSLICYESTFGSYAGDLVRRGADFFCVITEDGYWRDTSEPWQHAYLDRLRAIEHRRVLIRTSNHGLSGMIDAYGTIQYLTATDIAQAKQLACPIPSAQKTTFYSIWGDWLGMLALVYVAVVLLRKSYGFFLNHGAYSL